MKNIDKIIKCFIKFDKKNKSIILRILTVIFGTIYINQYLSQKILEILNRKLNISLELKDIGYIFFLSYIIILIFINDFIIRKQILIKNKKRYSYCVFITFLIAISTLLNDSFNSNLFDIIFNWKIKEFLEKISLPTYLILLEISIIKLKKEWEIFLKEELRL